MMATPKCDDCGQFIAWLDIESGMARYHLVSPDTDVSSEEWEILCCMCWGKEKEERNRYEVVALE